MKSANKILVTGAAGFIGSHLVDSLLSQNKKVVAFDNFIDFYDPKRKRQNIADHITNPNYKLIEGDLRNDNDLEKVFQSGPFDAVIHLAAMPGVRPSILRPSLYMDINVTGTQKLVDQILKSSPSSRLVFGSSSTVYGAKSGEEFLETDRIECPVSPYGASKAAGEILCYAAHHTKNLEVVCLRFFSVFGPRLRPDLALHSFCKDIDQGKTIQVFGDGSSKRDYTFIKDIVAGIEASMTYEMPGYDVINLGRSEPVVLMEMIHELEKNLGKKAQIEHVSEQLADMPYTFAGIKKAQKVLNYKPSTPFAEGVREFVNWYKNSRLVTV